MPRIGGSYSGLLDERRQFIWYNTQLMRCNYPVLCKNKVRPWIHGAKPAAYLGLYFEAQHCPHILNQAIRYLSTYQCRYSHSRIGMFTKLRNNEKTEKLVNTTSCDDPGWNIVKRISASAVHIQKLEKWTGFCWLTLLWEAMPETYTVGWLWYHFQIK